MDAAPTTGSPTVRRRWLTAAGLAASVLYVAVAVAMARHVTFYWDDYFLLLALDDRGIGGVLLTGINGNWWPLATLGLSAQLAVFGGWYPGYLATNAVLVVLSAWAAWFALAPLAKRRPWLLLAALVTYACSLGLVVNVTVMTMSWPLAVALAMTSAALAVRRSPVWAWGSVLALCFLAESGLFAVLATTVAAFVVAARMAERGWVAPTRRDLRLALVLVVLGAAGTAVGFAVANADPIDYYVTASEPLFSGFELATALGSVPALSVSWLVTPLAGPVLGWPAALGWLVTFVSAHLLLAVLPAVALAAGGWLLWRRRPVGSGDSAERWGRALAAVVLLVPLLETAVVLSFLRSGTALAPRYAILWLLPAVAAWVVVLQAGAPTSSWRVGAWIGRVLLVATAVWCLVTLPWTFRSAFDIDKQRWDRSPNQIAQFERCRDVGSAVADQQVSPGLRDDLLCQVVRLLDRH